MAVDPAAGTARPAGAGVTALGAAGPGAGTVAALSAVTADAADTAVAEQSGRSPGPAGTTRDARRAEVGALIKPSTCCSTLVASALAYALAAPVNACTNCS
ncbi:Uncharacterised protein [Mycobacterium tuberculosis]|nr:Uncharacterised protein [Mycobacterium tuberculosis]